MLSTNLYSTTHYTAQHCYPPPHPCHQSPYPLGSPPIPPPAATPLPLAQIFVLHFFIGAPHIPPLYSTVQYCTVQCSTVQNSTLVMSPSSGMTEEPVPHSIAVSQYCSIAVSQYRSIAVHIAVSGQLQYIPGQCSAVHPPDLGYIVQYSAVQCSAVSKLVFNLVKL